jgi:hypothetical protein
MSYYEVVLHFGVKELEYLASHTLSSYSAGALGLLCVWGVNYPDLILVVHKTNVCYIFTFRV